MIAAASAAAPVAAGAAGILVRLPGGAARHLAPGEVSAAVDRPAGTYLLRAPGTTAEPVAHPPALSVRRLVTLAGASPDAVSFVSIERPNGSLALLGRADLTDPAPFPDGPPIVWMDSGGARFLRPLRSPDDANGADNVDITGGDLVVAVHQGPLLVVRARADRRAVRAGTVVHFTAEIVSGASGQGLAYAWRFGDGAAGSGPAVAHAFSAPGVYEAVVTVNGSDDSGGSSAPLRIRVGAPATTPGATGGGTGDPRRSPAQGPSQGTGDDGGARPSGSGGASGSGSNGSGAGGSAGSAGSTTPHSQHARPTAPRPSATSPPAAASPPPAAASGPRAAPAPVQRRPPTSGPRTTPARRPPPRSTRRAASPRDTAPSGRLVRGTLVAARAAAILPGSAVPAAAAERPAAARPGSDPRRAPLAPAAGVLAALALVGLGARRERRAVRPRPEVPAA